MRDLVALLERQDRVLPGRPVERGLDARRRGRPCRSAAGRTPRRGRPGRPPGTASRNRAHCSGKKRPVSCASQWTSARRVIVIDSRIISVTRSGKRSAYASASVTPHDAPHTSHRSMPRCSRSRSMSAIRWWVVLVDRSVDEVAGVRRAQAAAPLVELDQAIALRVEPAAPAGAAAAAGSAVERDRGLAVRVARRLPVDRLAVADVEHPGRVRLDRRERARSHRPMMPSADDAGRSPGDAGGPRLQAGDQPSPAGLIRIIGIRRPVCFG